MKHRAGGARPAAPPGERDLADLVVERLLKPLPHVRRKPGNNRSQQLRQPPPRLKRAHDHIFMAQCPAREPGP